MRAYMANAGNDGQSVISGTKVIRNLSAGHALGALVLTPVLATSMCEL